MSTTVNLKDEYINTFIPGIKRFIEKEKQHLQFLQQHLEKIKQRKKGFFGFLFDPSNENIRQTKELISNSAAMLLYYETKLIEYEDYVKTL